MDWQYVKSVLKSQDGDAVESFLSGEEFYTLEPRFVLQGINLLRKSEKLNEAMRAAERLRIFAKGWNDRQLRDLSFLQGDIFHDSKEYRRAIACYDLILEGGESDIAYNNRGLAHWELCEYSDALQDYRFALNINPANVTSLRGAGEMCLQLGKPPDAIDYLKKAVELKPEYGAAWEAMGRAYLELGRSDDSVECFERGRKF